MTILYNINKIIKEYLYLANIVVFCRIHLITSQGDSMRKRGEELRA